MENSIQLNDDFCVKAVKVFAFGSDFGSEPIGYSAKLYKTNEGTKSFGKCLIGKGIFHEAIVGDRLYETPEESLIAWSNGRHEPRPTFDTGFQYLRHAKG